LIFKRPSNSEILRIVVSAILGLGLYFALGQKGIFLAAVLFFLNGCYDLRLQFSTITTNITTARKIALFIIWPLLVVGGFYWLFTMIWH